MTFPTPVRTVPPCPPLCHSVATRINMIMLTFLDPTRNAKRRGAYHGLHLINSFLGYLLWKCSDWDPTILMVSTCCWYLYRHTWWLWLPAGYCWSGWERSTNRKCWRWLCCCQCKCLVRVSKVNNIILDKCKPQAVYWWVRCEIPMQYLQEWRSLFLEAMCWKEWSE